MEVNGEDTGAKLRTRRYLSVSSTILRRNGSKHTVKQRVGDVRRSYDYISSRLILPSFHRYVLNARQDYTRDVLVSRTQSLSP